MDKVELLSSADVDVSAAQEMGGVELTSPSSTESTDPPDPPFPFEMPGPKNVAYKVHNCQDVRSYLKQQLYLYDTVFSRFSTKEGTPRTDNSGTNEALIAFVRGVQTKNEIATFMERVASSVDVNFADGIFASGSTKSHSLSMCILIDAFCGKISEDDNASLTTEEIDFTEFAERFRTAIQSRVNAPKKHISPSKKEQLAVTMG
jgi:hypothetical protein